MTFPLRLAHAGLQAASPAVSANPSSRVNPVVRGALLLFVFSIPFEMPDRSFPIEIPMLMGAMFLASTVLQLRVAYGRMPAPLPWFAAWLWMLPASMVVNRIEFVARALNLFVWLTMLVCIFWAISNLLQDRRVVRGVLVALVAAVALRAAMQVFGIGVTSHTVWTGGIRYSIWGQNANLAAMIISAGIAAVIGLTLSHADWLPRPGPFVIPLAGVMVYAIIQTGSRGGTLCAVLGMAVYLLSGRTVKTRIRNTLLGLLAIGALAWGVSRSELMRERFEQTAQSGYMAGREVIYPALWEMAKERPIIGWGPVDNQIEIARRIHERRSRKLGRDAHNLLGEVFTTTGLLGVIPFTIALGLCIRSAWRSRRGPLGFLPASMLTAVLVGCVSGTWIASNILWFSLAVAAGAGYWWSSPSTLSEWSLE